MRYILVHRIEDSNAAQPKAVGGESKRRGEEAQRCPAGAANTPGLGISNR